MREAVHQVLCGSDDTLEAARRTLVLSIMFVWTVVRDNSKTPNIQVEVISDFTKPFTRKAIRVIDCQSHSTKRKRKEEGKKATAKSI
jgi:hypothetical protein